MNLIYVSDARKREGEEEVLKGVSFTQKEFQKIAIAGESGCGKSTLLKIIAGLTQADGGEVLFANERVKGPLERLLPGQPGIAYLSQHFELRNHYRMEEILEYANLLTDEEAEELYKLCHISHLMKRKNDQLSGGEKQRIALARLLTTAPRLLILDEPFSNLDPILKETLKTIIRNISDKLKITCLLVSHDPLDTLGWAEEIIVMKEGRIVQQGPPEKIYHQPVDEYVAGLFGKYNLVEMNGKRAFVRPENFRIVTGKEVALKGTVKAVHFMGSTYELEVALSQQIVTVKVDNGHFVKGETVQLALSPEDIWYI
ncbi:ABC transporter ATP-binding protein [Chitinophaga tropicalis]|uniref:ATP-binding cassette domain-containing protein n=1 Tax=Chitinophaga tropicalis TaxID=2683588 RepID=A0A7K1U6J8_9BACT|nr:ABC transporter ATP-binding protein [Chitinophaga tropicalis]MVT09977.1 ATP-binding cassette domain-containing protein [Chitinophaga tropicalis]